MTTTSKSVADTDATVCLAAEKFSSLFYEAFDTRRDVANMYTDSACMVWNGNPVTGRDAISTFITSLPSSDFDIKSVDAQAIPDKLTGGSSSMVLLVAGNVKYENIIRCFSQTFILTAEGDKWKIASDRFRFID